MKAQEIMKRQQAILNNNDLYRAIFADHKIEVRQTDSIFYSLEKTPPLYSNLVTLSEGWKPDDIFEEIDAAFQSERWDEWSIKDSFGVLDLSDREFIELFDAQWIYLEAQNFQPCESSTNLKYEIVTTENALAEWRIAWDSDEELGKQIFSPRLLADPKLYFVAGCEGKQIVSGCFINRTDDVLGISNFFAPDGDVRHWSDVVSFIFRSIQRTDLVGYERKPLIERLQLLGFEMVGDLAVWLKRGLR